MSKPTIDLGLGNLNDFEPTEQPRRLTPTPASSERHAIDSVGRDLGFTKTSNPVQLPRRARRASTEQLHQINIRGPVSVMARFVAYCDDERLAYWEALDRFLKAHG